MTHITTELEEGPIAQVAYNIGVEHICLLGGEEMYAPGVYMVILNGNALLLKLLFGLCDYSFVRKN